MFRSLTRSRVFQLHLAPLFAHLAGSFALQSHSFEDFAPSEPCVFTRCFTVCKALNINVRCCRRLPVKLRCETVLFCQLSSQSEKYPRRDSHDQYLLVINKNRDLGRQLLSLPTPSPTFRATKGVSSEVPMGHSPRVKQALPHQVAWLASRTFSGFTTPQEPFCCHRMAAHSSHCVHSRYDRRSGIIRMVPVTHFACDKVFRL